MNTSHLTLNTSLSTSYILHTTLYTLYTPHITLYTLHSALHNFYTLYPFYHIFTLNTLTASHSTIAALVYDWNIHLLIGVPCPVSGLQSLAGGLPLSAVHLELSQFGLCGELYEIFSAYLVRIVQESAHGPLVQFCLNDEFEGNFNFHLRNDRRTWYILYMS